MSWKETKLVGTFLARDTKGHSYKINVYQEYHKGHSLSGPYVVEGLKELRTVDGEAVNYIEKGKYEVLTFGGSEQVTSDDPNAV